MMTCPQPAPCPHCRDRMPPGFTLCRACWKELTFAHRVELFTAEGQAKSPSLYPLGDHRLKMAVTAALSHLKQHSTAIL